MIQPDPILLDAEQLYVNQQSKKATFQQILLFVLMCIYEFCLNYNNTESCDIFCLLGWE